MNKRSIAYLQTHDMDFIFFAYGRLFHCATNGSLIPSGARTIKGLNSIRNFIGLNTNKIFEDKELLINETKITHYLDQQKELICQHNSSNRDMSEKCLIEISDDIIKRNYLSSFREMAQRGLYSYDYNGTELCEDNRIIETFELVIKPRDEYMSSTDKIFNEYRNRIDIPDISNLITIEGNYLRMIID